MLSYNQNVYLIAIQVELVRPYKQLPYTDSIKPITLMNRFIDTSPVFIDKVAK